MAVVGQAEIRITPTTTGFEASLRSQLQPILTRVEAQLGPLFQRAGRTAAESFSKDFSKTLGTQITGAVTQAAGAKGLEDAGRNAAQQFGRGLTSAVGTEVGRNLGTGIQRATTNVQRQVEAAGEQSGRTFGSGFGEGFAALAAFAIAARVGRFFRDAVSDAGEFADAMAGVRKNVDGTPEQFARFETTVKSLAERLGISAAEIAGVGEEAGKLGTPISQLATATETAVKASIALDIAAKDAASGLASFARLTDTPLSQISNLGSALAELDAQFGGSAQTILEFGERAAAGLTRLGLTAPEILGISAAFQEVGVRVDSGSRAIIRTIGVLQRLAAEGGATGRAVAEGLKLSFDEFDELARSDPGALFVRFLQSISGVGAQLEPVLAELGLDAQRLSQELGVGATSFERITTGIEAATKAASENSRLNRELAVRQESDADRVRRLEEAFRNTRIELGSKLAPVLIGILKPFAELSTGTTALAATFAGLAAGAFAFVRFSNILREFSKTLGGGALSANELGIAMQISQQQGVRLATVLRIVRQEELSLAAAQQQLAISDSKVSTAFQAQQVQTLGFISAFRLARTELQTEAVAQAQNAAATTSAMLANTAAAQASSRSVLAAGRAAFTAAGGFGALTSALGKASLILVAIDLFTQAERSFLGFIDSAARGKEDIEGTTLALQKLFAALGTSGEATFLDEVLKESRTALGGFRDFAAEVGVEIGNVFAIGPVAGIIHLLGETLESTGVPGVEHLGGAVRAVSSTVTDLANKIPFLGRVITTEAELATKKLADLNTGLLALFDQSPEAAAAVFDVVQEKLLAQGESQKDINRGLQGYIDKAKDAAASQAFFAENSDAVVEALRKQGLSEEEVARQAALMGISIDGASGSLLGIIGAADAATGALQRLLAAQEAFQQEVQSLIVPVSGLIQAKLKLSKASSGAGSNALQSARAIADAERALAEARRDAARRLADAQRRLAEAEEDAADRIVEARRRIEDARLDSTRSLRDAQQELQDFEAQLALVGGPQSVEDQIRLRELREALADETIDAARREEEAQFNLAQIQEENAERIAEAQRRLAETIQDNAEKIADALRRLARAHEDAANRQAAASNKMATAAEKVTLSIQEMTKGFTDEAGKLNTFADLMTTVSERVFSSFANRDLGEAFLADLDEMGVAAIPILKNLVGASDKELKNLGKAFENQIKAAKRAADFQFDKMPGNFQGKIRTALDAVADELEKGIQDFERYGGATGPMAAEIEKSLAKVAADLVVMLQANNINLTPQEQNFLDLANSAKDAGTRVDNLRKFIEGLRSRVIDVTANLDFDIDTKKLEQELKALVDEGILPELGGKFGLTIQGPKAAIPKMVFGGTAWAGQPVLVGKHTAEELFIPSTSGAIFKHSDTQRILDALRVGRTSSVVQHIQVNEVAGDPLATARAVSFRMGSDRAIR